MSGSILIYWEDPETSRPGNFIEAEVVIYCLDSRNQHYETRYGLLISASRDFVASDDLAPGVGLGHRKVKVRPLWWLKLCSKGYDSIERFKRRFNSANKGFSISAQSYGGGIRHGDISGLDSERQSGA